MSELTFTVLRLGYLVLLWLLVVFAIRVMRRDLDDKPRRARATPAAPAAVAPPYRPEPPVEPAAVAPAPLVAAPVAPAPVAAPAQPPVAAGPGHAPVARTSYRDALAGSPPPTGSTPVAPPAAAPRTPAGPTRLVVTEGVLRGTSLPLTSSAILIGRAPSCTLVLDDDYSSSRHARIFPQNGYWYAEDLGSTNGTFVGGRRIEAPVAVHPGDRITVGRTTMELQR